MHFLSERDSKSANFYGTGISAEVLLKSLISDKYRRRFLYNLCTLYGRGTGKGLRNDVKTLTSLSVPVSL